jgi:alkylresorcinol/alkylpyrone synthase
MIDATRVRTRHLIAPLEEIVRRHTLGERMEAYAHATVELGARAARNAMAAADVIPESVHTVISVSCTGYMLPSADAFLVSELGLDRTVRRLPITELGCSGGVAALGIASRMLASASNGCVLVVSVEPCSLCLQILEPAADDMMGGMLFGDGAAAAVVSRSTAGPGVGVVAGTSVLWPDSLDKLGMRLTSSGFRFTLSQSLPTMIRARVRASIFEFLHTNGVGLDEIGFWVIHPGGPKILESICEALDLNDQEARPSWDVWERCGNMSSASVFFILEQLSLSAPPPRGALGMMIAFGPGVTCEMLLLQSDGWLAERTYS